MIYPGAVWRPGKNAGYAAGRSSMTTAVCHYTVGKNSLPIMDRGYFNFLVARDGTVYQGAEADAVTWHAGNWNTRGPGIEVEHLDEDDIFTPEAYAATARLVEWLIGLGIPDAFYDGPRTNGFDGFITHRSLIQTGDAHHDYWPELPRITPAPAAPAFALTGDEVSFATAVIPGHLWETFHVTDSGKVVHYYYPRTNPDEREVVATGAKPNGDVRVVRQTADGKTGRADVWYEKPDGSLGHVWQAGAGDWAWHDDGLPW